MKIGVISNSLLGVQGIQYLIGQKKIAGVAVPDRFNEANEMAKMLCSEHAIPLHIVSSKNSIQELDEWLTTTKPDTVIAAGCPFKIEEHHLKMPELGFWNIHAGKMPEYAGADPIFWHIKNQEKKIVVTVHKMTEIMDAGPILFESEMELSSGITYGQLWQNLQQMGAPLFQEVVSQTHRRSFELKKQSDSSKDYSKKPSQEDLVINWSQMSADEITALVNACNPTYGGAIGLFRGGYIQILRLKTIPDKLTGKPGEIVKANPNGLWVISKDRNVLSIEITHMSEGYLTGADLVKMDIKVGDQFIDPYFN